MIVEARTVLCIIDMERVPKSFRPIVISIMLFIITSVYVFTSIKFISKDAKRRKEVRIPSISKRVSILFFMALTKMVPKF